MLINSESSVGSKQHVNRKSAVLLHESSTNSARNKTVFTKLPRIKVAKCYIMNHFSSVEILSIYCQEI